STNLVMASLGEETRASTRGPANHNAVALILPHKAMIGFVGGAIGADIYCDRTGILCRTIADCAKVLDALKDPVNGYYDPRDPFPAVPRSSILSTSYASHAKTAGTPGRCAACGSGGSENRWWFHRARLLESRAAPPAATEPKPYSAAH